jgi:hypothetical protein
VQLTQDWNIARQYSGFDNGKTNGSMWMIKPQDGAKVVDFSDSAQCDELAQKLLEDNENGKLGLYPGLEDIVNRDMAEYGSLDNFKEGMNPSDIVDSAQMFDVPDFTGWLLHEHGIGFAKTEDGAVCLDPEQCHIGQVDYGRIED